MYISEDFSKWSQSDVRLVRQHSIAVHEKVNLTKTLHQLKKLTMVDGNQERQNVEYSAEGEDTNWRKKQGKLFFSLLPLFLPPLCIFLPLSLHLS